MITKTKTPLLILLLMFCIIGCGEESEQILQSEVQSAVSENERLAMSSDGVPASPALFRYFMCLEWHNLSQFQRNHEILDRAAEDLGNDVGLSCKAWVRKVIKDASNGKVHIPSNNASGDAWGPHPAVRRNSGTSILDAKPGEIVQMQWRDNPNVPPSHNMHTAIVHFVSSNGVTFIESNFDDTPRTEDGPEYVGTRYTSEEDFNSAVQSFSIYYIE